MELVQIFAQVDSRVDVRVTFGDLGREAVVFYSHLADLLARKHGTPCLTHTVLCVIVVTQAGVHCLLMTPKGECVHIRQYTSACVTA